MRTAIIIHGTYGNPNENWFPWLKTGLEKIDYQVYVPNFPTPENQNLESWINVSSDFNKYIGPQTILVGHSLGAAFILSKLESLNLPIRAIFLVSGFLGLLGNQEFDNLNKDFTTKNFNWNKIKQNVQKIFLYHSDNDPYVPMEKAEELADKLNIRPIIIKGAGHFNEKAGYVEFSQLLSDIKSLDKKTKSLI